MKIEDMNVALKTSNTRDAVRGGSRAPSGGPTPSSRGRHIEQEFFVQEVTRPDVLLDPPLHHLQGPNIWHVTKHVITGF